MESQTLIIGFVFMIIFYIIKRPRIGPNEPPLVPYTFPILGHTYNYMINSNKFLKKCKEQYGECFQIYIFGSVKTIASRQCISEVLNNHDDFDFASASNEFIPFDKIFVHNDGVTRESMRFHAVTTREQVSGKLDINISTVQKYAIKGIEKWIGDCNDPKIISNAWRTINDIIALPVAHIFVGEEAASHQDLVKSFADLAFDLSPLVVIPPFLSFIHTKLHEFVITLPLRIGYSPVSHHRKVLVNRLSPVIEKRLKEKNELGDKYKSYNDLLEYYMSLPSFDYAKPNNLLYHIDNMFVMIFGAIVTTSKALTNAIFDLASRPEYMNELYEEALNINKECNGTLAVSDVQKMKKLDSFVKESLRHTEDTIAIPHYVTAESFTFSNGYTIPKGRMVLLYVDDALKSKEAFGDDAEEFKPFRFVNTNATATKVDRSFVVFGGGKHACPGRFFAVNEVKVILHHLILRYNISTKSGNIENKTVVGPLTLPSRGTLVFKKKIKQE